jgi:hypothetical protein
VHKILLGVLIMSAAACSSERTLAPAPQPQKSALLLCTVGSRECGPKPLLVIDGKLASWDGSPDLNPSEIETVEVVKGQAALRLYGPDARHGVVQITTRKAVRQF